MQPKVSVIIAAYNEEKYLAACLQSLQKQTYKPLEIIVADDGSTDKTPQIAALHHVQYINLNHQGTAIARNAAVRKSTGDIICFLDADMEFEKEFIGKLVEPICEKKAKGTFSKLEYVKNWDKPLARCWNRNNRPPLPDKLRVPQTSDYGDDFRAVLKAEFDKVGGFDNIGYNDTWTLAHKLGYKPVNAPGAIYYHNNPETYREVFEAAAWIGKRKYKLGKVGTVVSILRANAVFSVFLGILKAVRYKDLRFIPFKIVYDAGICRGGITSLLLNEVEK